MNAEGHRFRACDNIEVAVFLLVAQALVINRLAGLPYPLWNTQDFINSE